MRNFAQKHPDALGSEWVMRAREFIISLNEKQHLRISNFDKTRETWSSYAG
jgi:hypothetical protein